MPTERLAMRHVRDVIRLKSAGMPIREIARRVGAAPSTVRLTVCRFAAAGLTWPLADDVTDAALEARLFAGAGTKQGHRRHAEPDWAGVHRELKRKHVTLSIVWEEYIAAEPGGYRYSRFYELYRAWEGRLSVTMRQSHAAGDKLFVDYAGDGVPVVIDRLTGERRSAQIFVAVLGASNFTYAQATWTQGLADWISGHVGAFEAIGGRRMETALSEMAGEIATAAKLLSDCHPSLIVFHCTETSMTQGPRGEGKILDIVHDATGIEAMATSRLVLEALQGLGMKKVVLLSPYKSNKNIIDYLGASGIGVVRDVAMGLEAGYFGRVSPQRWTELAMKHDGPDADGIFLTQIEAIADIERLLEKPAVSSNQAVLWGCVRKLHGTLKPMPRLGRLMQHLN